MGTTSTDVRLLYVFTEGYGAGGPLGFRLVLLHFPRDRRTIRLVLEYKRGDSHILAKDG